MQSYISSTHLRNKSSGDDNSGAKHNQIMLEAKKDGLSCIADQINVKNILNSVTIDRIKIGFSKQNLKRKTVFPTQIGTENFSDDSSSTENDK